MERMNTILIGHNLQSNATGRLLCMADIAAQVGEVRVGAFGNLPLWRGAAQFQHPVLPLSTEWRSQLDTWIGEALHDSHVVLWLSKGLRPLDQVAHYVSKHYPNVSVILDIDDDDIGLARSFANATLINRIKLNPLRRGSSWSIERSIDSISQVADAYTFSTDSLRCELYPRLSPFEVIPHARRPRATIADEKEPIVKSFGFFGTIRPHKGGDMLLSFMRANRNWTMVTFRGCGLGQPRDSDSNWKEIPPDTPLGDAYGYVEVSLLPMDLSDRASRVQLPAKLIDAMRAGKSILASPTPAICEIGQDAVMYLSDAGNDAELMDAMETARKSSVNTRALEVFDRDLSTPRVAEKFSALVRSVIGS